MGLKEEFDLAVRDSITCEYKKHLNKYHSDNKYYDEDYAILIRKYFKNKGFESYELRHNSRYKCTPICAFASSGRLCYLHFAKKEDISFEVELKNDLPNNNHPTKMDAVKGDTNYECKCQEIVGKSHTPLSVKYLESNLFKEFKVQNYCDDKVVKIKDSKTGKEYSQKILEFDISELGIKMDGKNDYAHLHFDVKQLICHLIAIANNKKKEEIKYLQYVFFTPNKNVIESYPKVKNLYSELKKEIESIFAPDTKISKFAKKHGIIIKPEKYVEIGYVKDFNYEETYLNII